MSLFPSAPILVVLAALKFCFKTCVAMKFVDDDDDDDDDDSHTVPTFFISIPVHILSYNY